MKGLEALKRLVDTMPFAFIETNSMREIEIIEKELKALEIIKKKGVDIAFLKAQNTLYSYNQWASWHPNNMYGREKLTQEEFDLLKEILL